jgi:WhiB family redox-sensing transcriptional regulator
MAEISRLPGTNTESWDWQIKAYCRGEDPTTFFHPPNERGVKRAQRIKNAKAFCDPCPVKKECADHALTVQEPYGIWGGLSEEELVEIYKPKKNRSVSV